MAFSLICITFPGTFFFWPTAGLPVPKIEKAIKKKVKGCRRIWQVSYDIMILKMLLLSLHCQVLWGREEPLHLRTALPSAMKIKINFKKMAISLTKYHATKTGIRNDNGRQLSRQKNRLGNDHSGPPCK